MDFRRALVAGAALWAAIFFEVSILMFGFGLQGNAYYTAHYFLLGILTGAAALFYFNSKKAGSGLREGLLAGIAMLGAGIALDAIITVPLFIKSYNFFFEPALILGYMESVAIVAAVGLVKGKKSWEGP